MQETCLSLTDNTEVGDLVYAKILSPLSSTCIMLMQKRIALLYTHRNNFVCITSPLVEINVQLCQIVDLNTYLMTHEL